MTQLTYSAYRLFRKVIPPSWQRALGSSEVLSPLRGALIRPSNQERLVSGEIAWEDLQFNYIAPYRAFFNAKERGVENIICRLARATLRPGDTAIDVGANYGFVSMVMGYSVAPTGTVFSFELNPAIASAMKSTILSNKLESIVHLIPKGAGSGQTSGFVTVDEIALNHSNSAVRFLKVDTDGMDHDVLLGAKKILERFHPIVAIEIYEKPAEIYDLLRTKGYISFIDLYGQSLIPGQWPAVMVASVEPISLPEKGSFNS